FTASGNKLKERTVSSVTGFPRSETESGARTDSRQQRIVLEWHFTVIFSEKRAASLWGFHLMTRRMLRMNGRSSYWRLGGLEVRAWTKTCEGLRIKQSFEPPA